MKLLKRIEENKPLMIMLIGLPGSGKSTVAQSIFIERDEERLKPAIHSSDSLRKELFGDEATQEE